MKRLALLDRLKGFLLGEPFNGLTYFYNLDNNRADDQVHRELFAMGRDKPTAIELVETIGNDLPPLPGYDLLRDRSTPSRANIAVYVASELHAKGPFWIDRKVTWSRTDGPGEHPSRSDLVYIIGRMPNIVSHQPPKGTDNVLASQWEGVELLVPQMAPWKDKDSWAKVGPWARIVQRALPRKLDWDANRRAGEPGPGPDVLAKRVGGKVHNGKHIDNSITRNVEVLSTSMVTSVQRVALRSDHRHAVKIRWSVPAFWILGRKGRKVRRNGR